MELNRASDRRMFNHMAVKIDKRRSYLKQERTDINKPISDTASGDSNRKMIRPRKLKA